MTVKPCCNLEPMAVEIASEQAPDLPRLVVVALAALPPDLRSVETNTESITIQLKQGYIMIHRE